MARDLDLVRPQVDAIHGVATVREGDGLAMSSRNAYLSAEERDQAALLPRAMRQAVVALEDGEAVESALQALHAALLAGGFASVDYAELRDAVSLEPLERIGAAPARLLVAARIGKARLIDNLPVGPLPPLS
jgi:pantoate--beta-alanine ligase